MSNPFKNNSLASGLMGYILGLASLAGYNAVTSSHSTNPEIAAPQQEVPAQSATSEHHEGSSHGSPAFHGVAENPDGDVVITKSGGKYHSPYGCSSLRRSHETRTVSRSDAEAAGLTACSRCNP